MSERTAFVLSFALAVALACGAARAADDDKAEVVPLPDDPALEEKTPVKAPAETPKEPEKEAPKDLPKKKPAKKKPKEAPKEVVKEPAPEPAKEAATVVEPPPVKESPKEAPKEVVKEPPKEPVKEAATVVEPPPVKESPKEGPKETAKEPAKVAEPTPPSQKAPVITAPAETGDATGEPGAEAVPLPPDKPVAPLPDGAVAKAIVPDAPESLDTLTLTAESTPLQPGQMAVFSLYGPEVFLRGATAKYVLRDEFGRELVHGTVKVGELPFSEGKPRQFKAEVKNPLAQQHVFELALTGADGKQAQVRSAFTVPRAQVWDNWIALAATPPSTEQDWAALRGIGIRGGMQYRLHPARREALRKGCAPFYVENISRQLLSRYHTERGLWEKTIAAMSGEGGRAALMRDPSLCSQAFAEAFAKELKRHAEVYAKDPPLFYSLASEPSVTRLAAAADFDFSPAALQEFQRWLERDVYGTLKALNVAWDTPFAAWNEVVPMTTDEARMRLKDGVMNFGPWVDFRDFQDYTFSKVLRDGGDFLRQTDRDARVGITGALGPFAFGGWDWSRLARSLDVVEAYDIGGARALWRDLAPGKPALATLTLPADDPAATAEAARMVWSLALEGGPRGVIVWDDGKSAPQAQALAPVLRALDGELGALLGNSARQHDGVAVLYSPASVRVHWLFEAQRLHGDKWLAAWGADTGAERRESPHLRVRESWGKLLDDLGLSWRFVSSAQVESKEILKPDARIKTIVLPRVVALSDREVLVLKQFVQAGGQLVADAACGRFDEHGKLRDKPALDELFQIDTSAEPFVPLPMNPLERLRPEAGAPLPAGLAMEDLPNLAPVFSDRPKRIGAHQPGLEYRRSPVLATAKSGCVYLNLDVTDYLRWRLHPDQPRAQAVRAAVGSVALAARLAESPVDWQKTRLPLGTQVIRLQPRGAGSQVLALRRNPQARLHELGAESDGNWVFEKAEPFTLALRGEARIEPLGQAAEPAARSTVSGTLDPVTPALFVIAGAPPQPLKVTAPASVRVGEVLEINVKNAGETPAAQAPQARVLSIRLFAPDGTERPYHAITKHVAGGTLQHVVPLALNEPIGVWKIMVRDLANGGAAETTVQVMAAK